MGQTILLSSSCAKSSAATVSSLHAYIIGRSFHGACKVIHLLRCLPFSQSKLWVGEFDELLWGFLETLLCEAISQDQFDLASLPIKWGGLGVRTVTPIASAALLSSLMAVSENELVSEYGIAATTSTAADIRLAVNDFNTRVAADHQLSAEEILSNATNGTKGPSQSRLTHCIDRQTFNGLMDSAGVRQKALLHSSSSTQSGAWLRVRYRSKPSLAMPHNDFRALALRRLGVSLPGAMPTCAGCGSHCDLLGDHAVTCGKGGNVINRHDAVKHEFASILKEAGYHTKVEQRVCHDESRAADILIFDFKAGKNMAIDLGISSPFRHSIIGPASKERLAATANYEKAKKAKHERKCAESGVLFTPFILETMGGWGKCAKELIKEVSIKYAVSRKLPLSHARAEIKQRISFSLAKGNARCVLSKLLTKPR